MHRESFAGGDASSFPPEYASYPASANTPSTASKMTGTANTDWVAASIPELHRIGKKSLDKWPVRLPGSVKGEDDK